MEKFYEISVDTNIDSWSLSHFCDKDGTYYPSGVFAIGKQFPLDKAYIQRILHPGLRVDFHIAGGVGPVVSTALAKCITDVDPTAIQRIPIIIKSFENGSFEALNIIHLVQGCIDKDLSGEISYFPNDTFQVEKRGKIKSIVGLKVLPKNIPPDYHIFRLVEWLVPIVVSEKIKDSIESHKFTGITFIPIS